MKFTTGSIGWCLWVATWVACQNSSTNHDASQDASMQDASLDEPFNLDADSGLEDAIFLEEFSTQEQGEADRDMGSDLSLGENFALSIGENTKLCTMHTALEDPLPLYQEKGRLSFKPGLWLLPKDQDEFESDLVERLELSPNGEEAQAVSAGVFRKVFSGTSAYGSFIYSYERAYDFHGIPVNLFLWVDFQIRDGELVGSPIRKVEDPKTLFDEYCDSGLKAAFSIQDNLRQDLYTCQYELTDIFSRRRAEVKVLNGDSISFHLRLSYRCCCFVGLDLGELVRTEFSRGQKNREVTGFFRQVFTSVHHIFGQSVLAVFDSPVDSIKAVMMRYADSEYGTPVLQYLDADFKVIESPMIEQIQFVEE